MPILLHGSSRCQGLIITLNLPCRDYETWEGKWTDTWCTFRSQDDSTSSHLYKFTHSYPEGRVPFAILLGLSRLSSVSPRSLLGHGLDGHGTGRMVSATKDDAPNTRKKDNSEGNMDHWSRKEDNKENLPSIYKEVADISLDHDMDTKGHHAKEIYSSFAAPQEYV